MSWESTYANQVLTPQVRVTPEDRVPTVGGPSKFDLEAMLPLELIREHTKTDDVPSVSDTQLMLYREAAVEAAEQYTGFMLRGTKQQIEAVDFTPTRRDRMKGFRKHRLQYPVADGIIYLYGSRDGLGNRTIRVSPGANEVKIPITHTSIDTRSCCDPCGSLHEDGDWGMQIMYRAGYEKCEYVPAGIRLGMLKYIAWNITHPGDEISSIRNSQRSQGTTIEGTNNISWASGALELWRQYVSTAT